MSTKKRRSALSAVKYGEAVSPRLRSSVGNLAEGQEVISSQGKCARGETAAGA